MSYVFSVYGLSVEHPNTWKVRVNPNKPFDEKAGIMKIEDMGKSFEQQVSLHLAWETVLRHPENFGDMYIKKVTRQHKKTLKKEQRYEIIKAEPLNHIGHDACFVRAALVTNTHAIKAFGKRVNLDTLQLALYWEEMKKVVVATITATSSYAKAHYDELNDILFSLRCQVPAEALILLDATDGGSNTEESNVE